MKVSLYSVRADAQCFSNLAVRGTGRDHHQYLIFSQSKGGGCLLWKTAGITCLKKVSNQSVAREPQISFEYGMGAFCKYAWRVVFEKDAPDVLTDGVNFNSAVERDIEKGDETLNTLGVKSDSKPGPKSVKFGAETIP